MGSLSRAFVVCGCVVLAGSACAPGGNVPFVARDPRVATSQVGEIQLNIRMMLSFDANMDGQVSRQEVEAGLKRQFEAADRDGNGSLNLSEVQAENARRWQTSGTSSSPLIDWNHNGVVDFAEFAGTANSVFAQLDRDRGGTLAGAELEAPRVPAIRTRGPVAQQGANRTLRAP